jgi:hypothetical protein
MRSFTILCLGVALLAIGPVGCGIDRGGVPADSSRPAPVVSGRAGVLIGPIDAKGADSLTINDIVVSVDSSLLRINRAPVDLSAIGVGQYAVVEGFVTDDTAAVASLVDVDFEAVGAVARYDAGAGVLVVLGQTVVLDAATVVAPELAGLDLGDPMAVGAVRVSGYADGRGNIVATYLGPAMMEPSRLTGFARNINDNSFGFSIGPQVVSYASAAVVELPMQTPQDNQRVTVTGSSNGTTFNVQSLGTAPFIANDTIDGTLVHMRGIVTSTDVNGGFSVGFVPAEFVADAIVGDGDMTVGATVEILGEWRAEGQVSVNTLEFVSQ